MGWTATYARWGLVACAALLGACTSEAATDAAEAPPVESWAAPDATPDERFAALEEALVAGGPVVRIPFDITAEGAVSASLLGTLLLGEGNEARLEATGDFGGQQVDVVLISDGDMMFWTGAPEGIPTPPDLRTALGLGVTRMGILHNLARLTGGAPPDHAEGGVAEWVVVSSTEERGMLEGAPDGAAAASAFRAITVGGQPSGAFALQLDGRTPRVRRQLVDFPQGIMRVTERYGGVEFGADLGASTFDTTPLDVAR